MSKIVAIEICNFRKFKHFEGVFGRRDVVCLIGRGDSGKSSILEAISYCLAPTWSIPVSDYDFHAGDVSKPIEITAIVTDFPEELRSMEKYGLHCSGWDESNKKVVDATEENCIPALKIVLTIDASLEPKWEVKNSTSNQAIPIPSKDRAKLSVYMISDYLNNHFTWANGSPLSFLSRQSGESLDMDSLLDVTRKIRQSSKDVGFEDMSGLLENVSQKSAALGINPGKLTPAFDMKRLAVKEGAVCLHDSHDVPLRLLGKGSRRLVSIAIQAAVSDEAGITLIDEIEQGLEPDRICHLVHSIQGNKNGQTFFTTHSSEALAEMGADNVFLVKDGISLIVLPKKVQGLVRSNPWAFFGRKIILCEGKTECGFCRALDAFFVKQGHASLSTLGVVIVNGEGSKFGNYAESLLKIDIPFLLFCDSDEKTANLRKTAIAKSGVCVVEWGDQDSFEQGIYKELPNSGVAALNNLARELKVEEGGSEESAQDSMSAAIKQRDPDLGFSSEMLFSDSTSFTQKTRTVLGSVAKGKKDGGGAWFKTITGGIKVGEIVCSSYDCLPTDGFVRNNVDAIKRWVYSD